MLNHPFVRVFLVLFYPVLFLSSLAKLMLSITDLSRERKKWQYQASTVLVLIRAFGFFRNSVRVGTTRLVSFAVPSSTLPLKILSSGLRIEDCRATNETTVQGSVFLRSTQRSTTNLPATLFIQ